MNQMLPDIPRIYTAAAEWLGCLICMTGFKRRFSGIRMWGIAGAALGLQSVFLVFTKGLGDVLWILCMAAAVFFMYLFLFICCDISGLDAGYICIQAFVLAEFAASLEWQLHCFLFYTQTASGKSRMFMQLAGSRIDVLWLMKLLLLFAVYGVVYGFMWRLLRGLPKEGNIDTTLREVLSAAIIGVSVFLISNLGFVYSNTPFSGKYSADIFNIRTLVDLGGLAILYAYHVQRLHLQSQHELESMEMILHNQYRQYQQSQETLELIHYKYHDLKHHIIALRAEENKEKRSEYLDKMEEDIKNYGIHKKTGNHVLDTLLTSKSMNCAREDISLTTVVDGALLDFMDVMDICSIFGNALDNAIECERKIEDKEKRLIHVSVFSKKAFLIIRFENYCESKLEFQHNLPVTTKEQTEFHGYGLKSLRHTVHKYGGEVDINMQENWFNLKILIPL